MISATKDLMQIHFAGKNIDWLIDWLTLSKKFLKHTAEDSDERH